MESFTAMSDEAITAVIDALPERYPPELVKSDMTALVHALRRADGTDHPCDRYGDENCAPCWAASFLGSIAQTVGVEFI